MKVKMLDSHLINVIAAGEVIDRPASIVKELVENSLDAHARRVDVEIQQGGVRLIRVGDDGEGMRPEDLALAVQRHTTSKIGSEEDLDSIVTLGFRGEALASICEVARVTLSARSPDAAEGTELAVEGGKVGALSAVGRPFGTTVEVKDLFFNLRARRKFLKTDKTETLHITRLMKRFLFSHPQVHLRLVQGQRVVLDSPGSQDLMEIAAHLYGAKVAKGLVPVDHQGEIRVRGWVSSRQQSRGDRNEQYTFINHRAVSDAVVNYAINRAYEGTLEKQRYPYVCLHIELDPRLVDVNVHPQKHEVRFLDAQVVRREVIQALGQALISGHATPQLPWKAAEQALRHRPERGAAPSERLDLRQELEQRRTPYTAAEDAHPTPSERTPAVSHPPSAGPATQTPSLMPVTERRVVGQLHGTYIVVQTPVGFELIDQHVAHERVLYEQFLRQLEHGGVRPQQLLLPDPLKFPPDLAPSVAEHVEELAQLGIELQAFGPDTFLLRAWPQALAQHHAETGYQATLEHLIERLTMEGERGFESLAKVMVASLACEAAVVKNTLMPLEAMRHLVEGLDRAQDPFHCPHGRPIVLKYDLVELERAFKRR